MTRHRPPVHHPYPVGDDSSPATMARRLSAGLLDLVLVLVLGGGVLVLGLARASGALVLLGSASVLVVSVAQWVAHGRSGWTVGRRTVGIRTLDVETREPVGMLRVLLRTAVIAAGALAFGVGLVVVLASPVFDRTGRRRGWQDRAARDEVLDVRAVREQVVVPPRVRRAEPVQPRAGRQPVSVPGWAAAGPGAGGEGTDLLDLLFDEARPAALVLAPLAPQRSGPDLDTRATPVVRQVGLSYGLAPELEMTRPAGRRDDLVAAPVASAVVDRTVAEIELGDGQRVTIARTALVGRNPASDADVQLVRVVDPARSVSKNHLQIGVESGGVWVADRGSINGTVVTLPDGAQVVCRVDQQVRLRVGATVAFGDCSFRLIRAPGHAPVP
ncbi:RDD family protein [Cellulomonas sp. Leaf395]|uniref:RDD family protein n=1 Tax=Cellulomonas sp. Leaf395 TaxID=1736362 RepID=UPI0009EBA049|nr:RDD family protein [Cellulomonas sp. Leaf395]